MVQFEPVPDNFDYYVVSNIKTLQSNSHSIKHNFDETLILANRTDSILIQRISQSKGLDDKRKMDIPVQSHTTRKDKNDNTKALEPITVEEI